MHIHMAGVGKFLSSRAILFTRPIRHAKEMVAQNQSARLIATQLETLLFALYLLLSFLMCFHQKFSHEAFAV